ncbi:MAG TPA: hypothetical protein V6D27_00960 [Vampirovibrionales bacterium]
MKNEIQECLEDGIPTSALRSAYRGWLEGWEGESPPPGDESLKRLWAITKGGNLAENQILASALQKAYELNFQSKSEKISQKPKRKGSSYTNIGRALYGAAPIEIRDAYDTWKKNWQGECPETHDDFKQYLFTLLDIEPSLYEEFLIDGLQEVYELSFELAFLRKQAEELQQLTAHLKGIKTILNPPQEEV